MTAGDEATSYFPLPWASRITSYNVCYTKLLRKGVAKFLAYLSLPETQVEWHTGTGYVPITLAAYEQTRASGFYDKNPGFDMAVKELTLHSPTANSKGLRFGNFVQTRDIIKEELEAAFSGKKTAKAALDDAVKRGNEVLRKFQAANK